ncbi:type IV secretion system protein [Rubellimicrobium roseum]|uniref:Type IV secretion system protein n=1 Tax=Rubellimicrobium roseum TaxID=687525 RepID=A0A5C4NBD3_9RHOB|nr:type IV secretion system protein [Rubellimicrobium roseum]TNC66411.1 type IV secretion system protein [Rubellimicrobium roseum]
MVNQVEGFLDGAAESSFAAVAGSLGGILMVASTLLIVLVFVNLALQMRPMDGSTAVGLVVRLLLINAFALNWVQFNVVASAIIDGLDDLGAGIVEAVGGVAPADGFAEAFDQIMFDFANYLNAMTENMGWMGGAVATTFGMAMMGLLGALAGAVLIFAKVMLTLLIGIAPVMIATTLFEATKDYFHRWLSLFVGFAMYPLVIAGIMSTVIGMADAMADTLGDPAEDATLGALLPFFAMMFLAAGIIGVIPFLVRTLSGNLVMPAISSVLGGNALNAGAGALGGAASQARYASAGLLNTQGSQARARAGNRGVTETLAAGVGAAARANVRSGTQLADTMARIRRLEDAGVIPTGLKPKGPKTSN